MSIKTELMLRKETKFDKIRKNLFFVIFKEEYKLEQRLDNLIMHKRPDLNKIVIPKEIGEKYEKYKRI